MKTMKVLSFAKYGRPSVISGQDKCIPDPKPGEVCVEVHAAAIDPSDVKNVAGAFEAPLPRVPGRDYAGLVIARD
jgi:NADPH:quinone reductase-like Zn-dependent oxidoreductase